MKKSTIIPIHINSDGVWVGLLKSSTDAFGTHVPIPYHLSLKNDPTIINLTEKLSDYAWFPYADVIETPCFSFLPEPCKAALMSLKPISDSIRHDSPPEPMRKKFEDIYDAHPKFDKPNVFMDVTWIGKQLYVWRWNRFRAPFDDESYLRIPRKDYVLYTRYCLPIDHPHGIWESASMGKYKTRKHIADAVTYCQKLYATKLINPYNATNTAYGGELSAQYVALIPEKELHISALAATLSRLEESIPHIRLLDDEGYRKIAKKLNGLLEERTNID